MQTQHMVSLMSASKNHPVMQVIMWVIMWGSCSLQCLMHALACTWQGRLGPQELEVGRMGGPIASSLTHLVHRRCIADSALQPDTHCGLVKSYKKALLYLDGSKWSRAGFGWQFSSWPKMNRLQGWEAGALGAGSHSDD